MDKIQMVDLHRQYLRSKEEIDGAIAEVIQSARFIGGDEVSSFSENLASYLGASSVIPCGNGTDAIQVALMALDLEPGDEVITTPFTFVATVEVICLLGLVPVFVDIDPATFNIDVELIEEKITEKTKVILPVHLFGASCEMDKIMSLAKKYGLFVIEDNAQSIGGTYNSNDGLKQTLGLIGDIGTTSFFPSKNLGAYGDGGAVFTQNKDLAAKINEICNHGSTTKYFYNRIGVNSRLDAMQAAILNVKLANLDQYIEARREAAKYYASHLDSVEGIVTPSITEGHVFHQYTLRITKKNRDEVRHFLEQKDIPSMIYYPKSLHVQAPYQEYAKGQVFPETMKACREVLSLPMHTELKREEQDYIISTLKEAIHL